MGTRHYTYNDADAACGGFRGQLCSVEDPNGHTTSFTYDDHGNLTAATPPTPRRDHLHLRRVGPPDHLHRRARGNAGYGWLSTPEHRTAISPPARTPLASPTVFHNGPVGLSAQTTGGVDMHFTRCPEGDLHGFRTGGKHYYYLADILGSIEAVVDENGNKINQYLYELFGTLRPETTEEVPQPYHWAGGYQDPTLQYHLAARYLDPHNGRFTQPDPSGQELNPYLYATGDPTNRTDGSGLFGWGKVVSLVISWGVGVAAATAVAAACAGTGGLACIFAASVTGGLWGGAAGGLGAVITGSNPKDGTYRGVGSGILRGIK